MACITGDWTDSDWLIIVEDDGPRGLGRVLGYVVVETQEEAERCNRLGMLCEALGLFVGEDIPSDVVTEVMSYADFKGSYGNRMPLVNRGAL